MGRLPLQLRWALYEIRNGKRKMRSDWGNMDLKYRQLNDGMDPHMKFTHEDSVMFTNAHVVLHDDFSSDFVVGGWSSDVGLRKLTHTLYPSIIELNVILILPLEIADG